MLRVLLKSTAHQSVHLKICISLFKNFTPFPLKKEKQNKDIIRKKTRVSLFPANTKKNFYRMFFRQKKVILAEKPEMWQETNNK